MLRCQHATPLEDGPWFLRGVTILDDLSPSGYREVDVLLGLEVVDGWVILHPLIN